MGADISQLKQIAPPPPVVVTQPDLDISDPLEHHGDMKLIPKSHSSYTHFADYSMFPDRFNSLVHHPPVKPQPQSKRIIQSKPVVDHHYSDYSLYPDKFDEDQQQSPKNRPPDQLQSSPIPASSLPAHPGLLSRFRRPSEAEHDIIHDEEPMRPRSLSHNSRMYYFDFSLIPDKDPHCAWDERKRNKSLSEEQPIKPMTSNTGSSAPVQNSMPTKKRMRQTSLAESKFSFFDYSMIPDKDPRLFSNKPKTTTEAATADAAGKKTN